MGLELLSPGHPPVSVAQLDNPLFRFRIGEALAGRLPFTDTDTDDDLGPITTELPAGPIAIRVATGADANERLAEAMRVIQTQSLPGCRPPRLLTGDGEALATVVAGLRKVREVSPALADDLLAHVGLLVILDPATSGGLISASSRLFPGLILIDRPSSVYEVAEAIIHEGAHVKLFDFAITRNFLGADVAEGRVFRPSWSSAGWPVEQVMAAFHAYTCLAQFAEDVARRGETTELGPDSLLSRARERATEIGRWLLGEEDALEFDAKWLLHTLMCDGTGPEQLPPVTRPVPAGHYALDPLLRLARMEATGRVLAGRPGNPPELHWLDGEAADLVVEIAQAPAGKSLPEIGAERAAVLGALVEATLVRATPRGGVLSSSDGTHASEGN
ncbi:MULTISPECIES: aKG-HExxH-type peptide beta-hydroxylase [Amycolatopsis]|uniref:aKG-HExxH-type peptide beta-hydroxylase n=1 Tax=Amycolatopsis TaxID=1813 RepID=UPI001E643D3D|nr:MULTISPECIES: HEXXH motif-containing putative peptide modification protein [Amycolatopsis]